MKNIKNNKGVSIDYKNILESLPEGIVIQKFSEEIIHINTSASSFLDYKKNTRLWEDKEVQNEEGEILTIKQLPFERIKKNKTTEKGIFLITNKKNNKSIWVQIQSHIMRINEEECIITSIFDVNDHKRRDKKQEVFTNVISHDVKSLLTSIKAYTQILERQYSENKNDVAFTYVNKLHTQINKLTRLVIDWLDVLRIQTGKFTLRKEPINLKQIVEEITETIQSFTDKKIITHFPETFPEIHFDKDRLLQVLEILLFDAINSSSEGKNITIAFVNDGKTITCTIENFRSNNGENQHWEDFMEPGHEKLTENNMKIYIAAGIIKYFGGELIINYTRQYSNVFTFTIPLTKE